MIRKIDCSFGDQDAGMMAKSIVIALLLELSSFPRKRESGAAERAAEPGCPLSRT